MKCSKSVVLLVLGVITGTLAITNNNGSVILPTELTITSAASTTSSEFPVSLTDPKVVSVQKANVQTLSSSSLTQIKSRYPKNRNNSTTTGTGDKTKIRIVRRRPVKITAYTAEEAPEQVSENNRIFIKPVKFSKLISKEPTKITVSLFEETKKKSVTEDPSSTNTKSSSFNYPPIFSKLVIPQELQSQRAVISEFEPLRMVESSAKILKGGILHELHPPPETTQIVQQHITQPQHQMYHYFQPHSGANYQYFSQGPPTSQLQLRPVSHPVPEIPQYYPTVEEVGSVPVPQENEVQIESAPQTKHFTSFMGPPSPLPSPQYNFAYRVHDSRTGTNHGHTQFRSGSIVHGRYALMDPDGLLRTVSYTSHPVHGFKAVVNRQPPAAPHFANAISPVISSGGAFYGSRIHHRHGHPGFFSYR